MDGLHLSAVRQILASGRMVALDVLTTKGEMRHYEDCVSLKADLRKGYRNIKLARSGEIRKIKDILIVGLDGHEVYI